MIKTESPIARKTFISSDGLTQYTAQVFLTFDFCPCPGFKHRETCKHVNELKTALKREIKTV